MGRVTSGPRRCVVEWRHECQRWFVTLPDVGLELAPAFDCWITAAEIAGKYEDGHAFCGDIPCMTIETPFPRPDRMQPSLPIALSRYSPQDPASVARLELERDGFRRRWP